jgi:ribosomal protein L19E
MQITNQKRLAAKILTKMTGREVGVHRVWINPAYVDQI